MFCVTRLHQNLLPKTSPKIEIAPVWGIEIAGSEPPLTDTFERCYVPEVSLLAGVAKLAYAADSKSAGLRPVGVQVPPPASCNAVRSNTSRKLSAPAIEILRTRNALLIEETSLVVLAASAWAALVSSNLLNRPLIRHAGS